MTKEINKKLLFAILIFILSVVISTFIIQYGLNHQPCKLCLYERIPYYFSILLIAKIIFIKGYEKITLLILSLVFIISSILAFYHFGIEQGFFKETVACTTSNLSEILTKEEILKQLEQNAISCKNVSFTIFGLSLSAVNAIFSITLSALFIKLYLNYEKN